MGVRLDYVSCGAWPIPLIPYYSYGRVTGRGLNTLAYIGFLKISPVILLRRYATLALAEPAARIVASL